MTAPLWCDSPSASTQADKKTASLRGISCRSPAPLHTPPLSMGRCSLCIVFSFVSILRILRNHPVNNSLDYVHGEHSAQAVEFRALRHHLFKKFLPTFA